MLLEVRDLDVVYGHTHAVRGLSLQVDRGEIVTVLGSIDFVMADVDR